MGNLGDPVDLGFSRQYASSAHLKPGRTVFPEEAHRLGDRPIYPAWSLRTLVGFEHDTRENHLAGHRSASCYKLLQLFSFGLSQGNEILLNQRYF